MRVSCICIDNKNKPDIIPMSQWVNEGTEYHVTHVYYHHLQKIQGVLLEEIKLSKECAPYESYVISRFGFTPENFYKLIELMKLCTELNEVDIKKLLEETNIELV